MVEIKLNIEEANLLHDILSEYTSDLRMEISDTHDKNYKEILKGKENFLKKITSELKMYSTAEPVI